MKKTLLFTFLTIFISCAKTESQTGEAHRPQELTADEYKALTAMKSRHTISYEEAKKQAVEFASLISSGTQTKSASRNITDGIAITSDLTERTKSNSLMPDTIMYLFNFANDEGYVFISADERTPGLLSFTEEGYFNIQDSIECPGTAMLLSGLEVYVMREIEKAEYLKDSLGEIAMAKQNALTNTLSKGPGGAGGSDQPMGCAYETVYTKSHINNRLRVQTNWGQEIPFDGLLPRTGNRTHAYVGCSAVAVAQIMAHLNHPQSYAGVPLYTSELRQYKNWNDFTTPSLKSKIAIFNKFVFDNVIENYDDEGSGGGYEKARNFLRALGISTPWSMTDYNLGDIIASIDTNWLVYTTGYSHREKKLFGYSYSKGHAWIIDDYSNITTSVYAIKTYSGGKTTRTLVSSETKMYLHCNMGWSKYENGYYIDAVFDTRTLPVVKTKSNISKYYQYNIEIAPRIRVAE